MVYSKHTFLGQSDLSATIETWNECVELGKQRFGIGIQVSLLMNALSTTIEGNLI
jgi:hypothetical protein